MLTTSQLQATERVLTGASGLGMGLLQIESSWWSFVAALALSGLVALAFLIYLGQLRRKRWQRRTNMGSFGAVLQGDQNRVSSEIERLCSGEDLDGPLIRQMSPADRAMFEVSIIDALNSRPREGQHRLRSALIKCGYDEHCARRVMSEDLSDRVRATTLLSLLRPQWRDALPDTERTSGELAAQVLAANRVTGRLDAD